MEQEEMPAGMMVNGGSIAAPASRCQDLGGWLTNASPLTFCNSSVLEPRQTDAVIKNDLFFEKP